MPPPAGRWIWTRHWPIPMPSWAAMKRITTGILPAERPSTGGPSNSIPTMRRRTSGTRRILPRLAAESRRPSLKPITLTSDPLSPIVSFVMGAVHVSVRKYDQAIETCKKLANESPTFGRAHFCLASAYWGKHMYPEVIEELRAYGQLSGDRNDSDFVAAMGQGFRSAGWKGALINGIETRKAQRKTGYSSAYEIATLYADLGDNGEAFRWLS